MRMATSKTSDAKGGRSTSSYHARSYFLPAWIKPAPAQNGQSGTALAGASAATDAPRTGAARRRNALRARRAAHSYSVGEEIANSVTHGVGALLSIAGLVLCIVFAMRSGGGVHLAAALIYSIMMLLEYLMSTLYHAITNESAKHVFKVLDHSCIYLYIAGSYTPFCLITLADCGGYGLCAFVWTVALVGVACESFWVYRPRWVSAAIYLLLGWAVVVFLPQLASRLPGAGMALLVAGGVCFSVGCVFYVLKRVRYMHSVFHVFVLAGSAFQFFSILLFVL